MVVHNSLVWVHAHEQLTRLGELHQKFVIMRDELLYRLVMAEISEVAEDGHEPLRLEWVAVDINFYGSA